MKKTVCMLFFACLVSWPLTGMAQRENRFEQMAEKRAGQLADSWKLEGEARTGFLSTYKEYIAEQMKHRSAMVRPERDAKKASEYTDEEANARITAEFDRKAQEVANAFNRLEVDKKYYELFAKSLTPQQLVEIFAPVFNVRARGGQFRQGRGMQGNFPMGGGMQGAPMGGGMGMDDDW